MTCTSKHGPVNQVWTSRGSVSRQELALNPIFKAPPKEFYVHGPRCLVWPKSLRRPPPTGARAREVLRLSGTYGATLVDVSLLPRPRPPTPVRTTGRVEELDRKEETVGEEREGNGKEGERKGGCDDGSPTTQGTPLPSRSRTSLIRQRSRRRLGYRSMTRQGAPGKTGSEALPRQRESWSPRLLLTRLVVRP